MSCFASYDHTVRYTEPRNLPIIPSITGGLYFDVQELHSRAETFDQPMFDRDFREMPCFYETYDAFSLAVSAWGIAGKAMFKPGPRRHVIGHNNLIIRDPAVTRLVGHVRSDRLWRFSCQHSDRCMRQPTFSDSCECHLMLVAIQPYAESDEVYCQLGFRPRGKYQFARGDPNMLATHSHPVAQSFQVSTDPEAMQVSFGMLPSAISDHVQDKCLERLIARKIRFVNLTDEDIAWCVNEAAEFFKKCFKLLSRSEEQPYSIQLHV